MGSSKTVFRRLLPRAAARRATRQSGENGSTGARTDAEAPAIDRPVEPSWGEIFAAIRAIISGDDQRAVPAPERRKSDRTEMPDAARARPRSKAERNNLMVMILLGCDVLLGMAIGLVGFFGLESDGIALVGAALATGGILLMLIFQLAGKER